MWVWVWVCVSVSVSVSVSVCECVCMYVSSVRCIDIVLIRAGYEMLKVQYIHYGVQVCVASL